MSFYNGQRCDFMTNNHVFDEQFLTCECGVRMKQICRCAECGTRHEVLVDTPADKLLLHRVGRLEARLAELEQPSKIQPSTDSNREDQQLVQ